MGTPVLAAYAGRVAIADFLGGYGLAVVLDHNKDTSRLFMAIYRKYLSNRVSGSSRAL